MNAPQSNSCSAISAGLLAGAAGALVMMAMRTFDQRYAPRTIPQCREDPALAAVKGLESAVGLAGKIPHPLEKAKAASLHVVNGAVAGAAYGVLRGRGGRRSALCEGGMLGLTLYIREYVGWLPLLGFTRPIWKQSFPEIAGEALRHVAYGVTTAAIFGAINGRG